VHFKDRKRKVDQTRQVAFLVAFPAGAKTVDWDSAQPCAVMPAQLLAQTRLGARGALLFSAALPASEFGGSWPEGVPLPLDCAPGDGLGELGTAAGLADGGAVGGLAEGLAVAVATGEADGAAMTSKAYVSRAPSPSSTSAPGRACARSARPASRLSGRPSRRAAGRR